MGVEGDRTRTAAAAVGTPGDATGRPARALLACGIVAGPIYVVVGAIEMLTRPGFDVTRHDLSLLANGDWGWVHSTLLVTTGLLTVAGAGGLRRALRGGRGGTSIPLLVGLYGLGLTGAGFFSADPAFGFPPGTPASAHAVSWHGLLHLVTGAIGFLGLIAACLLSGRRFGAQGRRGWAVYSLATGVLYFAAFLGIAAGSGQGGAIMTAVILAFSVAVVLGWAWISAMAARPLTEQA
jgi:hypothetical protein